MRVGLVLLDTVTNPGPTRRWLTGYLRAIGVEVNHYLLKNEDLGMLSRLLSENDALIVIGGAGNKEVVKKIAEALGLGVEVNSEALEALRLYYSDRINVPPDLEDKALMPEFSYVIPNERGPTPGFVAFSLSDDSFIAATPPKFEEAVECFETGIQDFFREKTGKKYSATFVLYLDASVEEAEHVVNTLSGQAEGAFIRLDARFMGTRGVPLVFTVYASTPEELSEKMDELESRSRELVRSLGKSLLEKEPGAWEEEL
ncbi:hypothetical protein IG193_07505 [Infirmifilum lucidum]|uniref:MoaB/Mog domain-containing protein n=1 Tax=Infirmifilum lucidum TaxID=2776706 RepID=A0A7L9FIJ4_9CREN|nr:hypothetical protein [Infirmifilum lucidum]QOJ78595.1 hypothetical protein IG193_07505 [Infirmifilum lucidum]